MSIHPQALVDPSAKIGKNVEIGPWTLIGPDVEIGDDTQIMSHVVIKGPTKIGKNNRIFQFASVGEECQDKKFAGEQTRLEIGDDNIIRESCTIHRGTTQDQGVTSIGSGNLFMAYVHVAHDCVIGNDCILANTTTLAGHVHVADNVILGGGTMVHQFCKIGTHSMAAGGSIVLRDIPAYVMASGQSASAHGLNSEGLKRRGFDQDAIRALKDAYRTIYRKGLRLAEALEVLEVQAANVPEVRVLLDSLKRSERGIVR